MYGVLKILKLMCSYSMSERVRQENVWLKVMAYQPNAGGLSAMPESQIYMVFYHPPGPMSVDVGIEME